ncbi:hypothetical protein LTR53_003169 [Teratosphaeriaceae sp. CCFEE 6253]|nr:hypothetical protein LTR53_003169 [Teratosphaeriaceae sp. CCFEE 6253]
MGDQYRPNAGYGGHAPDRSRAGEYHRRDHYNNEPPRYAEPYQPSGRDGYTFRGAAERDSDRHRPQNDFSFRAQGPHAPRFPPAQEHPPPQRSRNRPPPAPERNNGARPIDVARSRHAQSHRGRGGFRGGRAAHQRNILRADRATTPEQLEGMNVHGKSRFLDIESISSDDDESDDIIDLTRDSDGEEALPRKRTKLESPAAVDGTKWSNPDPYTVLPPPETLGAPKKDIVQVIRKAKAEPVARNGGKNAVKENTDFISFNFDDEDDSDESEAMEDAIPVQAPAASASFSHRTDLHAVIPSAQEHRPSFTAINGRPQAHPAELATGPPPEPPPDFVMPTDEELMEQYVNEGRSTKRKRGDGRSKRKGDIVDEWDEDGSDPTPWCTVDHSRTSNVALRLHKEICDFYEFVRPHAYEEAVRRNLIVRVERGIQSSNGKGAAKVKVHCFGSFAAGLYLPTADMDLVAVSPEYMGGSRGIYCQSTSQMYKLKSHLEYNGVAPPDSVAVVGRAKVPIIKFPDKTTGLKVDISFENDSGIVANRTFEQWKRAYPAMPVVVVLVKQLLAMRGLNEVFTGGIGGFTTICLVVSMLQLMPELQADTLDPRQHYGELLMTFLDLYGNKFDVRSTGIRMDPPSYFNKIRNPAPRQNLDRLTIVDPNNPDNDVSGGSHEIDAVLDCFKAAHAALQRRLAEVHAGKEVEAGGSVLGCVLGGNYGAFVRQREKLSLLHRGYAVSPPPPPAPKPVGGKKKKTTGAHGPASQSRGPKVTKRSTHALPPKPKALPPRPDTRGPSEAKKNGYASISGEVRDHYRPY